MKKFVGLAISILIPAFIVAGGMASSAVAQEKAAQAPAKPNVLLENDKVRVYEITQKPGEENTAIVSISFRIVRVLKGGTLQRTHADGKKDTVVHEPGEVWMNQPGTGYISKNIGTTDYQVYVVQLK